MKKIAFSLLIFGLAAPMIILAQSTLNVFNKQEPVKPIDIKDLTSDIGQTDLPKLISPIKPVIAPVVDKLISPQLDPGKDSSAQNNIISTKVMPIETPKTYNVPSAKLPACYIDDSLMKQYDSLIAELQNVQKQNDTEKGNIVTQKIIELKKEISASKTNCGSKAEVSRGGSSVAPEVTKEIIPPVAVKKTPCEEVKHWEEKIAFYKKLIELTDSELKKQTNLSRDEINNILEELTNGLVKLREQCNSVSTTATDQIQAQIEVMKPVGVQSAQEIREYYKAKIEAATQTTENSSEQIQKLKELKTEKDLLVGELINNKKEIQATELGELAKEIKINRNEIVADGVPIEAKNSKILLNVGSSSISIIPAGNKVLIKEKGFDVSANDISISDGLLKIGGTEVKLPASQIAEKLKIAPQSAELTIENSQPVYKLKIAEPRKLFGIIKIDSQNTQTADANSGDLIKESKPWYYFLTTK